MMSKTVVALALLEEVAAFQAPVVRARQVQMFSEGDIGVLPPLGVYDPLGLIETRDMRRYEIMEIKHGRAAMLGFLHTILIEAGARFPGYLSPTAGLKFSDVPSGCIASLEALPTPAWLQARAPTLEELTLSELGGTITADIAAFTKLTELKLHDMGLEGARVCPLCDNK